MAAAIYSCVYGAALVLGGLMGFAKGSTASLIAGGGSGLVMLLLEAYSSNGENKAVTGVQLVVAGGLAYQMNERYQASGKVMPAGLVAFLSIGAVTVYGARLFGLLGESGAAAMKKA